MAVMHCTDGETFMTHMSNAFICSFAKFGFKKVWMKKQHANPHRDCHGLRGSLIRMRTAHGHGLAAAQPGPRHTKEVLEWPGCAIAVAKGWTQLWDQIMINVMMGITMGSLYTGMHTPEMALGFLLAAMSPSQISQILCSALLAIWLGARSCCISTSPPSTRQSTSTRASVLF